MALQPPSPQSNVPRNDVANVVDAMLLDSRVKWIGIVFEAAVGGGDRFIVTPYVVEVDISGQVRSRSRSFCFTAKPRPSPISTHSVSPSTTLSRSTV